jgi:putative endonuclease
MRGGWVYIMTNRPNGTSYVGITNNLAFRVYRHRTDTGSQFCRRYGVTRLVYFEWHEDIRSAIPSENNIKDWPRAWKVRLIRGRNPDRVDLYDPFFRGDIWKVVDGGPSPAMTMGLGRAHRSAHTATPTAGGGTMTPCAA